MMAVAMYKTTIGREYCLCYAPSIRTYNDELHVDLWRLWMGRLVAIFTGSLFDCLLNILPVTPHLYTCPYINLTFDSFPLLAGATLRPSCEAPDAAHPPLGMACGPWSPVDLPHVD